MRIANDFEVPAAPGDTYELLVDLERVAACIPGGEVGPAGEDGAHPASIAVRLGPMRMTYRGTVRITERDDEARCAVLSADVREQRGQGAAAATMTMTVGATGSGSAVETVTEVDMTGRAAQMGRGVIDDVAARLVDDMASCIAARLAPAKAGDANDSTAAAPAAPPPQAKPISGFRLMLRVLWARLRRPFSNREEQ